MAKTQEHMVFFAIGAGLMATGIGVICHHFGMPLWKDILVGITIFLGLQIMFAAACDG